MVATLSQSGNRARLWSWSESPTGRPVAFHDRGAAERHLQAYLRDPGAMSAMRTLLAGELGAGPVSKLPASEVLRQVAARLVSRRLVLTEDPIERSAPLTLPKPRGEEPAPPPPAKKEEEHALVLILEDKEGKRLPRQRYVVAYPNGEKFTGRLGEDGKARLTGVPAGDPKVFFPDHYVVSPHGHRPSGSKHCGGKR